MSSGVPPPIPHPQVDCGPGPLAQAGDVGTATRGRHDALGGAARDVVINLSACRGEREGWGSKPATGAPSLNGSIIQLGSKWARYIPRALKTSPKA